MGVYASLHGTDAMLFFLGGGMSWLVYGSCEGCRTGHGKKGGGAWGRWWGETGKAECCLRSQQTTARWQSPELLFSPSPACLREGHTTGKDQLCWVSPGVFSNLQSCPPQVLDGGQAGAHGIILACLRGFRVTPSQQTLHSLTDSFSLP